MNSSTPTPISIVGIGCRFPGGAMSADTFWENLIAGKNCITNIPSNRWHLHKFFSKKKSTLGKSYQSKGGFLTTSITDFDPLFFNISPREAEELDPQQKILLEITWEAIEDAGITNKELKKKKVGVFIGGFCFDKNIEQLNAYNRENIGIYTATSSSMTMISNRISHVFDFKGPSLSIDTACSSSLVAIHYATKSLELGECDLAVTGGVNLMLYPEHSIALSKGNFLSPSNNCWSYDSRADGYVRGEGAGIVILEKKQDAEKKERSPYANILSSGLNQDGHTLGITTPNYDSQKKLIRYVYDRINFDSSKINYLEGHGTGTQAGDPTEFKALNDAVNKSATKKYLGSVKSNIGHLEAAAGVAGLIKTVLVLKNRCVPKQINFKLPNPKINYISSQFEIPLKTIQLPLEGNLYAGINSFGYGGTNCHILLSSEKTTQKKLENIDDKNSASLAVFSAKSKIALRKNCSKQLDFINNLKDSDLQNYSATLGKKRSHFSKRLAFAFTSKKDLESKLKFSTDGQQNPDIFYGDNARPQKIVFVFSGMGPQWAKLGYQLYKNNKKFCSYFKKTDDEYKKISGWSLKEKLFSLDANQRITTDLGQPANFFFQLSFAKLLKYYGVKSSACIGHSIGEIPAAFLCGAIDLKQALKIVYARSNVLQSIYGQGDILAAQISESEGLSLIKKAKLSVCIAAVNSENSIAFSGSQKDLEKLQKKLDSQKIFNRLLNTGIPFHSEKLDSLKKKFFSLLGSIKPEATEIPFYSSANARITSGHELNEDYWWKNLREKVLFQDTIIECKKDYSNYIEISPHPVLKSNLDENLSDLPNYLYIESFNKKSPEVYSLSRTLANLYTLGEDINWNRYFKNLPTLKTISYQWDRKKSWRITQETLTDKFTEEKQELEFNFKQLDLPEPTFETTLNQESFQWMRHHSIHEHPIFPGAAFITAIKNLQNKFFNINKIKLKNVNFLRFLKIESDEKQKILLSFHKNNIALHSKKNSEKTWYKYFDCEATPLNRETRVPKQKIHELQLKLERQTEGKSIYKHLKKYGFNYVDLFHGLEDIWIGKREALGAVKFSTRVDKFSIPPWEVDYGFQLLPIFLFFKEILKSPVIPTQIETIEILNVNEIKWVYAKIHEYSENEIIADIYYISANDDVIARIKKLTGKKITDSTSFVSSNQRNLIYHYQATKTPLKKINSSSLEWAVVHTKNNAEETKSIIADQQKLKTTLKSMDSFFSDFLVKSRNNFFQNQTQINIIFSVINEFDNVSQHVKNLENLMKLLEFFKKLTQTKTHAKISIVILTNRAFSEQGESILFKKFPIFYIFKCAKNEIKNLQFKLIDFHYTQKTETRNLTCELDDFDDQIVLFKHQSRFVLELKNSHYEKTIRQHSLKLEGENWLVSGGTGGLGKEISRLLANNRVKNIFIISKNPPKNQRDKKFFDALQNSGVRVVFFNGDVGNEKFIYSIFQRIQREFKQINGIVHCAATLSDSSIPMLTKEKVESVFRPKALGAMFLDKYSRKFQIKRFIFISSVSNMLGNPGQLNYIYANAYAEYIAHQRTLKNLPATIVNIGAVKNTGLTKNNTLLEQSLFSKGIKMISSEEALTALEHSLSIKNGHFGVFDVDWNKYNESFNKINLSPIEKTKSLRGKDLTEIERIQIITDELKKIISSVLKIEQTNIESHTKLTEYGIDSLVALEISTIVSQSFDLKLNVFDILIGVSIQDIAKNIFSYTSNQ